MTRVFPSVALLAAVALAASDVSANGRRPAPGKLPGPSPAPQKGFAGPSGRPVPPTPVVLPKGPNGARGKPILPGQGTLKPRPPVRPVVQPRVGPGRPQVARAMPRPVVQNLRVQSVSILRQNQSIQVINRNRVSAATFRTGLQRAVVRVNNSRVWVNVLPGRLHSAFACRWWNPRCGCYVYWSPWVGYHVLYRNSFYPIWAWQPGGPVVVQVPVPVPSPEPGPSPEPDTFDSPGSLDLPPPPGLLEGPAVDLTEPGAA
jgi:hypothetical protein